MTLPLQNPDAAAIHIAGNAWLRSYGLTFNPNVLGGYLMSAVLSALLWINRRTLQVVWLIFAAGLFLTLAVRVDGNGGYTTLPILVVYPPICYHP